MNFVIRYTETSDGVRIGYAEAGSGYPLVVLPGPPTLDMAQWWKIGDRTITQLCERFRVILYDARGFGHSQRQADDFSLEAMLDDFEAVSAAANLRECACWALAHGVPTAIAAAARWPEVVAQLIVTDGWLCRTNYPLPGKDAAAALQAADWEYYTEYFARVVTGELGDRHRSQLGAHLREVSDSTTHALAMDAHTSRDVSALAPLVRAKTLVVHSTVEREWLPPDSGADVAAAVPGARLVLSDDVNYSNSLGLITEFVLGAVFEGARPSPTFSRLSAREREVAALVATGLTNREIAESLTLSESTVMRHVHNILTKVGARNRTELARHIPHDVRGSEGPL